MSLFRQVQYSITVFLGLAVLLLGALVFSSAPVSLAGAALLLSCSSWMLSRCIETPNPWSRFVIGLLATLSMLMIAGSALYYLGTVTLTGIVVILGIIPCVSWLIGRSVELSSEKADQDHPGLLVSILIGILVLFLILFFRDVTSAESFDPTRSPWLVVPTSTLLWMAGAALTGTLLALKKHIPVTILAASGILLASVSVAAFVFPLGYGFDPFLHQATVDHIALHGTITPKPFYYIGQYALELVLVLLSGEATQTFDTLLLPILAALFLPVVCAASLWQTTKRKLPSALGAVSALLIPLSGFINTTPQGLANLWSLCALFLFLPELATGKRWVPHWMIILIALSALLTHPLAGLPVALFVALGFVTTRTSWPQSLRTSLLALFTVGGSVMLPAAFFFSGPGGQLGFNLSSLGSLVPPTFFSTRYEVIGDLLALLGTNSWLWLLALSVVGGVFLRRMQSKHWLLYPLLAGALLVNAVLLSVAGDFSFLIDYEQTNYVDRVIQLTLFALLPLSVIGISLGLEKLHSLKQKSVTIGIVLLVTAAITANVYYAYPRHDAYAFSRGFTVGQSDFNTVASISSDAKDSSYVVLANQAVSAAAIATDGFAHYWGENEDVFYYPVPTGGPLYKIFLEMIEEVPTQELATEAMDLADVDLVYFVVNDYWWSANAAVERAKVSTEDWFELDDGATTIFVYRRTIEESAVIN